MSIAFYVFTILIVLVSVSSAVITLSAYFVSRRKSYLYTAVFFFFYALDIALIFQYEYAGQNLLFSPTDFYVIDNPYLKILIGLGSLEAILLFVCDYCNVRSLPAKIIPAVFFCFVSVAIVVFLPEGNVKQWLFYTVRQVFLFWCLTLPVYSMIRSKNDYVRMRLRRFKFLYLAVLLFIVAITTEDIFMILVWQPDFHTSLLPLYLSQRNFSENFMMLLFAFLSVRASARVLRLRFHEPPDPRDNPNIQTYIDELLPKYCIHFGLTLREKDILVAILNGKSTQNIASELYLATGTVKTHIHNILAKTNNDTRETLIKDFWRE